MKKKSNVELESSHHDDFVSDTFTKFMELWKNGKEASLNINCKDGKAWIQISCFLGYQRNAKSFSPGNPKRTKPSPSKLRRDRERAENFRLKKRQEASRLEQSNPSKGNTNHFEVEIPNTSQESWKFDEHDTTVVSNSEPSLVDAHEETLSGSNHKTPIVNSSTPEKQVNSASEAFVVTPIKFIDWDKDLKMKVKEWENMSNEGNPTLVLKIQYLDNVQNKFEASDYEAWLERYQDTSRFKDILSETKKLERVPLYNSWRARQRQWQAQPVL